MNTVEYIQFKQRQKNEAQQKVRENQDKLNHRLHGHHSAGLGIGYGADMAQAMKKVRHTIINLPMTKFICVDIHRVSGLTIQHHQQKSKFTE